MTDPFIKLGTEAKTADRLEALTKANHGGRAKHHDPLYNANGRNGFVAEITGGMIQTHGSDGGKALTNQGGKTALEYVVEVYPFELDSFQADGNIAATPATNIQ